MAKKTNILVKLELLINQIISMLVLLVVLVRKIPPYGNKNFFLWRKQTIT